MDPSRDMPAWYPWWDEPRLRVSRRRPIHRSPRPACHGSGMDEGPSAAPAASGPPDAPAVAPRDQMPRWMPAPHPAGGRRPSSGCWPPSWLLTRLHDLLLTFVVALFLSFALEPAVDSLARRGWRRGPATGLVLVVLLGTLVVFFGLIGKLVVDQITQFIDQAPAKSQSIEHWINRHLRHASVQPADLQGLQRPERPDPRLRHPPGRQRARVQPERARRRLPLLHHPAVHLLPGGRRSPVPPADLLVHAAGPPTRGAGQLGDRHPEDRRLPLLPAAARDHPGRLPLHRLRGHRRALPAGPGPVRRRRVPVRAGGRHLHRQRLPGPDRPGRRSGQGAVGDRASPSSSNRSRTT